jgi:hypothetical protein
MVNKSFINNLAIPCTVRDSSLLQQATGNRQQATGNRQQATGNRQQATGNRQIIRIHSEKIRPCTMCGTDFCRSHYYECRIRYP